MPGVGGDDARVDLVGFGQSPGGAGVAADVARVDGGYKTGADERAGVAAGGLQIDLDGRAARDGGEPAQEG